MINIFIYKDNNKLDIDIRGVIKEVVSKYKGKTKLINDNDNIDCLLEYISQNKKVNTIFVMDMRNLNLDLLSQIRNLNPFAYIILINQKENIELLLHKKLELLEVIDYNDQQLNNKLFECIVYCIRNNLKFDDEKKQIVRKCENEYIVFHEDNIMYFETSEKKHKIYIQVFNNRYEFYGSLSNKVNLFESFFHCHKSYVVNTNNIKKINIKDKSITMIDGSICYFSQKKYRELLDILNFRTNF